MNILINLSIFVIFISFWGTYQTPWRPALRFNLAWSEYRSLTWNRPRARHSSLLQIELTDSLFSFTIKEEKKNLTPDFSPFCLVSWFFAWRQWKFSSGSNNLRNAKNAEGRKLLNCNICARCNQTLIINYYNHKLLVSDFSSADSLQINC